MIILGIDPGYAIVGYGILEKNNNNIKILDYGVITTSKDFSLPDRLLKIYDGINYLIDKYKPDCLAIEELFFNTNTTTAIAVAESRGVVLLACKLKIKNLYEYTPLQIKQALTGNGRAEKKQVQYMVKAILNLNSIPKPDDAADALAVAICHSQTSIALGNFDIK